MDRRLIEYEKMRDDYERLTEIVFKELYSAIHKSSIHPMQVVYRLKTRSAVEDKLIRKHDKYNNITDMTDISGFRVVCYFSDQVNTVARILDELFIVDKVNSIDKRSAIPSTVFGYISLHYICTLPRNDDHPEELCSLPFEIQIRSVLQHAWAEIEHDLGYKSEFEVPKEIRREFSRLAGLLEIADELFINIRDKLTSYKESVRKQIAEDDADDLTLDRHTLSEYLRYGRAMQSLLNDITNICDASIQYIDPEAFLQKLEYLDIRTLGELNALVRDERDYALGLARDALENSEIDTLTSSVGLYYLCMARLIHSDLTAEEIEDYYRIDIDSEERVIRRRDRILRCR